MKSLEGTILDFTFGRIARTKINKFMKNVESNVPLADLNKKSPPGDLKVLFNLTRQGKLDSILWKINLQMQNNELVELDLKEIPDVIIWIGTKELLLLAKGENGYGDPIDIDDLVTAGRLDYQFRDGVSVFPKFIYFNKVAKHWKDHVDMGLLDNLIPDPPSFPSSNNNNTGPAIASPPQTQPQATPEQWHRRSQEQWVQLGYHGPKPLSTYQPVPIPAPPQPIPVPQPLPHQRPRPMRIEEEEIPIR